MIPACEDCGAPRTGMPLYAVICLLCAKREGLVERNTGRIVGDRRKRVEPFPNLSYAHEWAPELDRRLDMGDG